MNHGRIRNAIIHGLTLWSGWESVFGKPLNSNAWEGSFLESVGAKGHGNFKGKDRGWDLRLPPSVFSEPAKAQQSQQGDASSSMSQSGAQAMTSKGNEQLSNTASPPPPPPPDEG